LKGERGRRGNLGSLPLHLLSDLSLPSLNLLEQFLLSLRPLLLELVPLPVVVPPSIVVGGQHVVLIFRLGRILRSFLGQGLVLGGSLVQRPKGCEQGERCGMRSCCWLVVPAGGPLGHLSENEG